METMGTVKNSVVFHINGVKHEVHGNSPLIGPKTALVDYIRDVANLKGTKVTCREGGCGACTVSVKVVDPVNGKEVIKSVNSCLTPILSCDGWEISTVEALGDKHDGYHVVQNRIVNFHGTQCGYCTPGMVMNMYGLLGSKSNLNQTVSMEDVESNLDGNICRCTGYRPILDGFKSIANDAREDLLKKCVDIEDCITCPMRKNNPRGYCSFGGAKDSTSTEICAPTGHKWIIAKTLEEALAVSVKNAEDGATTRFVGGNTSTGIFKREGPYELFIDINGIPDLRKASIDDTGITLGGGTTLTEVIRLLKDSSKMPGLEYTKRISKHIERVANVSVRNTGTIAGNLMIKHKYHEFPSDIFVILECIGAKIRITGLNKDRFIQRMSDISPLEFLKVDMKSKLIESIHLPTHADSHFRSFKITRRYQNAHAYVNAALLFKVDENMKTLEKPNLVFGGISDSFIHAVQTESILKEASLSDQKILMTAFQTLGKELKSAIQTATLESSPQYRIQLAQGLLYKTILEILGDKAETRLRSGGLDLPRLLQKSKQDFASTSDTPLYKAIPKYEAGIQASGEAEYTGDIPPRPNELYGTFVCSTVACADLVGMDASEAMRISGVYAFITANDIPGVNDTLKYNFSPSIMPEPVFATNRIYYYGQALGLILASAPELSRKAAELVKVTYANPRKPIVSIDQAMKQGRESHSLGVVTSKPDGNVKVTHKIKGTLKTGSQYHFHMENQVVICYPREDGIDVYSSTQWVDHVQNTISHVLGIPTNSINVQCRRVGGGFGAKLIRPSFLASACAVATYKTGRPVRIALDLETNMSMLGMRLPYHIPYEVGFDDEGRVGSLKIELVCDTGYSGNEPTSFLAMAHLQNIYKCIGWHVDFKYMTTDTSSNTSCRAPGSTQGVAVIEWIMEHIASYLEKDPLEVRMKNMLQDGDPLLHGGRPTFVGKNMMEEMLERMKIEGQYEKRMEEIAKFNKENKWKKRGIAVLPVRYPVSYWDRVMPASVVIYHRDGQVAVGHGGIEMGQGLNTKAIQVVAQGLGVPISYIKVKPTNNFVGANAFSSGGTITSEMVCYSLSKACEELRKNLNPILEKLENPTWEKLVEEAYNAKVCLTASYTPTAKDDLRGYDVWVLSLTEVEIDVLTGEYKITKTHLYEDTGKSLSPAVDLGQIEGGYIFGQGMWTTEKIVFDEETGKLLTNGTWDYKVPFSKDIPEDFHVTLLQNAPNPHGVLRSKSTGEPSVDAAFCVVLALRNAVAAARADLLGNKEWFEMPGPVTPEDIQQLCNCYDNNADISQMFSLK